MDVARNDVHTWGPIFVEINYRPLLAMRGACGRDGKRWPNSRLRSECEGSNTGRPRAIERSAEATAAEACARLEPHSVDFRRRADRGDCRAVDLVSRAAAAPLGARRGRRHTVR